MSKSIGMQIDKLIETQSKLEIEFDALIKKKTKLTELVDQEKINDLVKQIKDVARNLKNSTNDICKSLSENPDIPQNLKKAKDDKDNIKKKLEEIKEDLRNGSMEVFNNMVNSNNSG